MTGTTSGAGTLFSEVRVARSLVFCVVFCRSLFVFLSFFFCPLCFTDSHYPLTLYQRNPDMNHKFWNIGSTEKCISHMQGSCWNVATYKWKFHNRIIEIISFVVILKSTLRKFYRNHHDLIKRC
jgi:hypothetical protein